MKVSSFLLLSSLIWMSPAGASAATPAELDGLIAAAKSAPAEFSADALIRLADVEQLAKDRRIDLLAQAFERASGAQEPYKRHAASMRTDGSAGYWNRVYGQDLDGLSLRLRAIESMLPLDKVKARELFVQIPTLATPRVKCEDFQVYDVGRFYEVLGTLAQQVFDEKETEAGEPFKLLQRYAGAMTSPVQAAPLARVLAGWKGKDDDFKALVGAYATSLGKISGDDRSFVYSSTLGKEVLALVDECKRRHVTPLPLIEGYRLYLVINLSAVRCADDDLMQGALLHSAYFRRRLKSPAEISWASSIRNCGWPRYNPFKRPRPRRRGLRGSRQDCECVRTPSAARWWASFASWSWLRAARRTRPPSGRSRSGKRNFASP